MSLKQVFNSLMPSLFHLNTHLIRALCYISRRELHLIIINFSKVVSLIEHLSGRKMFPAMLNSLSTGAELAGMARYFKAKAVG